jgi:hypothetical protein
LGGAVKIAARPNRTGIDDGVVGWLLGLYDGRELMLLDRRLLPPEPAVEGVETISELRRVGVKYEEVERDSEEAVRGPDAEALRPDDSKAAGDEGSKPVGEDTKVD